MFCVCSLPLHGLPPFVFILIPRCRWPIAKIICGHRPSHINYVERERERERERDWDNEIDLLRCLVSSSDWQFAQLVTDLYKDFHTKRRHFGTIDKAVGDVTQFKCRQVSLCVCLRLFLTVPPHVTCCCLCGFCQISNRLQPYWAQLDTVTAENVVAVAIVVAKQVSITEFHELLEASRELTLGVNLSRFSCHFCNVLQQQHLEATFIFCSYSDFIVKRQQQQ